MTVSQPKNHVPLTLAGASPSSEYLRFFFDLTSAANTILQDLSAYALVTSVTAVANRATALEADVAALESDVAALQSDVATLESDLTALTATVAARNHIKFQLSCSDLTTALTTGTNVAYFRATRAFTITDIRASLLTASSSGAVTVDVNVNGSTILSTKLTIDANEKTSTTAATPHVRTSSAIADDYEITVDIDGAGTNAAGLILTIIGTMA